MITFAPHFAEQRQVLVDGRRLAYVSPGLPLLWIVTRREAAPHQDAVLAAIKSEFGRGPPRQCFIPEIAERPAEWDELQFEDVD